MPRSRIRERRSIARIATRFRRVGAAASLLMLLGAVITAAPSDKAIARSAWRPASSIPTTTPIKHVIFIVKENRSFDNMFAAFPGVNAPGTDSQGRFVAKDKTKATGTRLMQILQLQRLPTDIRHTYFIWQDSWNHGAMNGFNVSDVADKYAFTYLTQKQIPNYWRWAKDFVLSDNFFASAAGPSFPNHIFTIAAQAGRTHYNPNRPPSVLKLGLPKSWGCDSPKGETVPRLSTTGKWVDVPPCFDIRTVGDLLNNKDIGWRYYSAFPPVEGYTWSAYDAIRHIRETRQWPKHVSPVPRLLDDIRNTRLPPVTWITPEYALSEHPEFSMCYGENWTTRIVDAVMRSPIWKNTAIFITWDDWGGFYDHVRPPQDSDGFGLGFRVPLLMLSPYAMEGLVDKQKSDFSSVLRFIEDNWTLPHLNHHDRTSGDLSADFDFSQAPRPPDPRPPRTDCRGPVQPAGVRAFDPD